MNLTLSLWPTVASPELARQAFFSDDLPAEQLLDHCKQLEDESYLAFLDMLALVLPKPYKVQTPLLVLGAARNNMIAPKEIETAARAYNTHAEIIPDVPHSSMLDLHWESVAERILAWLDDQLAHRGAGDRRFGVVAGYRPS